MPRQKKVKLIGLGLPANLLREFIDLSYKGNTSIAPENYEIDTPLSDSRVKVYKKIGSNQVIITHRGSVGLQDWWDNAKFLVAGKVKNTKSYKMHRERHLKAVEKYGAENIIGIGHSRAGLYLQELQKEVPIKEIITYNKAVGFYDALRENPAEQTDIKVKNDFVSLLSGLQKRPKPMVEIEATKNPLDFNKAHQPAEIEKLGDQFIGLEDKTEGGSFFQTPLPIVAAQYGSKKLGLFGSGQVPTPKTLEQLKKKLKTLEGKLEKINKGKVYKTTNKEKVEYELSYTKARIKNHETNGEDLIITKKKKYGNELPAKAKAYKAKEVKPKKEEPKKEEPKPKPPKIKKQKAFLLEYKEVKEESKSKEVKEESKSKEVKKEDYLNKMTKAELITYYEKIREPYLTNSLKNYTKKDLIFYIQNREKTMKEEKNTATEDKPATEAKPAIKTKAMLLRELENIILNKDADEITELLKSMGFGNANLTNQTARQDIFKLIKLNNASKSKKQRTFNIDEFITRFNKENCEDLMCKYGINSKAEFRKWIVKNHPDKGGTIDDADFKQIIKCAIKEKYCTKKMAGGLFEFTDAQKARAKKQREASADAWDRLTFGKKSQAKFGEAIQRSLSTQAKKLGETLKPAQQGIEESAQQGIEESDQQALEGGGFYYLDEISNPTNPIYIARSNENIPSIVEPETEYLVGGAFTDMAGMNCDKTTGSCFNPVWEKEKIKRQILSEYKIWYNPFAPPVPGTIRMAWLPKMIEERYKPLYDEFVARRNVNIGLPADASKDRFAQQMFSNLTDGLSYVPGSNLATIGLTAASALSDTKKGDGT